MKKLTLYLVTIAFLALLNACDNSGQQSLSVVEGPTYHPINSVWRKRVTGYILDLTQYDVGITYTDVHFTEPIYDYTPNDLDCTASTFSVGVTREDNVGYITIRTGCYAYGAHAYYLLSDGTMRICEGVCADYDFVR